MMQRRKITVVGAGNVGGATAQRLAEKQLVDEIVLLDIQGEVAQGKALDLAESAPLCGYDTRISGTSDYALTRGSDLVVITSGVARKPWMSRDDLLQTNARIVGEVVRQAVTASPDAILVVVSNPLDAMSYVAHKVSKLQRQRVVGMAGVLDSARMAAFIAAELSVSVTNVQAFVLGGHGDTMVPLPRYTTVSGVPLPDLLPAERIAQIVQRTREGGAEIVRLLKTGSAFYAPSAAVVEMVEAILLDRKKIMTCAALCESEYGVGGYFVGVPVRLGLSGVESIVELNLTSGERAELEQSIQAVAELCRAVDRLV